MLEIKGQTSLSQLRGVDSFSMKGKVAEPDEGGRLSRTSTELYKGSAAAESYTPRHRLLPFHGRFRVQVYSSVVILMPKTI